MIATTDSIGRNAIRTLKNQEKPVGQVLRGDLVSAALNWPTQVGQQPKALPGNHPRPHQRKAIERVLTGFQSHDRGQLIMACGTGKTLTAMWITERLESRRTLVLVPSLSLISQSVAEWGRSHGTDFDCLVVCSDESVANRGEDHAITSTNELGIPVTTNSSDIRRFLRRRHRRPSVIFCTYQSSDRVAEAQKTRTPNFDLVLADEAHRCTGHAHGLFTIVLDESKIKAKRRLFLTATPRYLTGRAKKRAGELDYEVASMDDETRFGPEFHRLTFNEAIEQDPPLLTDYQVVVIGVTDAEAQEWVKEARLVRGENGLVTDARTLAVTIGLAKAMRKHDLSKIITFHSSVAKAKSFTDEDVTDSLPAVVGRMKKRSRPRGKMWTRHITGFTPAGLRTSLLQQFGELTNGTRGVISNCACLSEGVDVPVLDGVAFIDPKRSTVDIIQAIGRVIRKAENKQIGTIVIPVFIDESEDAESALLSSAFEPVWRVLRALRAHDVQLADELDELRLKLGERKRRGGKLKLPVKIRFDVPTILLKDFEQAFYAKTIERTSGRRFLPFAEARAIVHSHGFTSKAKYSKWCNGDSEKPDNIPNHPNDVYKEFTTWGDWLGTGKIASQLMVFLPFKEARAFARKQQLQGRDEWMEFWRQHKPEGIPASPRQTYKCQWRGWSNWLGNPHRKGFWMPYKEAREFARRLGLKNQNEWKTYCQGGELPGDRPPKPNDIPAHPEIAYKHDGWPKVGGWGDWLGTGNLHARNRTFWPFKKSRAYVRKLGLKSSNEWRDYYRGLLPGYDPKPSEIPTNPDTYYKHDGWPKVGGWDDWLAK